MFKRVVIIGVGQIGGSLGWELRKKRLAREVVGVGRTLRNLRTAVSLGLIDSFVSSPDLAVKGADLIVLATPVQTIPVHLGSLAGHIEPGAVVTDVGSVKGAIMRTARLLGPQRSFFVGSHPIAGSEKSGASSATRDLFMGKVVILTPIRSTKALALKIVKNMWRAVGAQVVVMDPVRHDRTMAFVSHIPHLFSYAYTNAVSRHSRGGSDLLPFAGGSFRDFTRIAGSSPEMWEGIFHMNWKEIQRVTQEVEKSLHGLSSAIRRGDRRAVARTLVRARGLALQVR